MNPLLELVYSALDELQAQNPGLAAIPHDPETALYGNGGLLGSLDLVSLIVIVTEAVQDRHDVSLTLVDEKAFSANRSPFRSIGALADYVQARLHEEQADA